ncbi:hypothetical protein MJL79_31040, partial [Salmonella enterica subsp. enterica serovar Montevideo]|nr:hypothetical protein [Salmonella enterica subsp. enterica serovar Montevideo]
PDENRAVLAAWIGAESKRAGEIHPAADNNWRLAPIHSDTALDNEPRRFAEKNGTKCYFFNSSFNTLATRVPSSGAASLKRLPDA